MPKIFCVSRASSDKQENSLEVQRSQFLDFCRQQNLTDPIILEEPLGTSARKIPFRLRPCGGQVWREAEYGDTLVVTKLDRLGRTIIDILNTTKSFRRRGVRVIVLQFGNHVLDTTSPLGKLVLGVMAIIAQFEAELISQRTKEAFASMKERGLVTNHVGFGRKIIGGERTHNRNNKGGKVEWDYEQLAIIAELVERRSKREPIDQIAKDFWRRGLKDHHGHDWGWKYRATAIYGMESHSNKEGVYITPYRSFYDASLWFLREGCNDRLPPEYNAIAKWLAPRVPGFRLEQPKRNRTAAAKASVRKPDPDGTWTADEWREWYQKGGKDELEFGEDD